MHMWISSYYYNYTVEKEARLYSHFRYILSLPTLRQEGDARAHGYVFHRRKMRRVATNVYSRKTSEKPEKDVVYKL